MPNNKMKFAQSPSRGYLVGRPRHPTQSLAQCLIVYGKQAVRRPVLVGSYRGTTPRGTPLEAVDLMAEC